MNTAKKMLLLALTAVPGAAMAQIAPPAPGVELPQAYFDVRADKPGAFQFEKAWIQKAARARARREAFRAMSGPQEISRATLSDAEQKRMVVAGTVRVPLIMIKYSDTGADPYPPATLDSKLFSGAGLTMTKLYDEMSSGLLTLTGDVLGWVTASNVGTYYEGGCNGVCGTAKTGQLILEALQGTDAATDFGQYDNDGPDGIPNSGDDDGFVDFIAIVQPEIGGECSNTNMWSHRWVVTGWPEFGAPWTTNDPASGGGFIRVLDYTIQPALGSGDGCGGGTIEIGVYSHEFGHAFGLPDLYDTDEGGEGIGEHGLMGSGNWKTPDNPTHMSSFTKERLGWLMPVEVGPILQNYNILDVESSAQAYQLNLYEEPFARKTYLPLAGSYSLHCGWPGGPAGARNWATGAGYGNMWDESIECDFYYNGSGLVTLEYDAYYDCEATYDFAYLKIDVGGTISTLATMTGTGTIVDATIDLTSYISGAPKDYTIIAQFTSDEAYSDEDGLYNSTSGGPFKLDNISVTGGGEAYFSDFEQYEDGWHYDETRNGHKEYFLVENRSTANGLFDKNIHAPGLVIWHIEEYVYDTGFDVNTGGTEGTTNLRPAAVTVEEADGLRQLLLGVNRGDPGDSFPGSTSNTTFDNASNPNSTGNNAWATRVLVQNISTAAATMTADMRAGRNVPILTSITPNQGANNGVVSITDLQGGRFVHGAAFLLRSSGAAASGPRSSSPPDINGQNVRWIGKGKLVGEIDLNGVAGGTYDVVVRNPDGQEATLVDSFTVNDVIPVFVTAFTASMGITGPRLMWDVQADEAIQGFRILRAENGGLELDITPSGLIAPDIREFVDDTVQPGVAYDYFLIVVLEDGSEVRSRRVSPGLLAWVLELAQNHPNPFNPTTTIDFVMSVDAFAKLIIYDVRGREIVRLVEEVRPAGTNSVTWNGINAQGRPVSSGVYLYRLTVGKILLTKKLILLK